LNSKDNAFLSKKLATIEKNVELEKFDLKDYKFEKEKILNEKIKELFRNFDFNSLLPEEIKQMQKWDDL
jgi:5'-3' exonuclease